jgi:hypothetical protein
MLIAQVGKCESVEVDENTKSEIMEALAQREA